MMFEHPNSYFIRERRAGLLTVPNIPSLPNVKNKGHKVNTDCNDGSPTSFVQADNERKMLLDNLEMSSTGGSNDNSSIHDSDLESLMDSPCGSSLDHSDSVKNLNESSNSGCSENVITEDIDDGCLDDWEAVTDALNAEDNRHNPLSNFLATAEVRVEPTAPEPCIKDLAAELSPCFKTDHVGFLLIFAIELPVGDIRCHCCCC